MQHYDKSAKAYGEIKNSIKMVYMAKGESVKLSMLKDEVMSKYGYGDTWLKRTLKRLEDANYITVSGDLIIWKEGAEDVPRLDSESKTEEGSVSSTKQSDSNSADTQQ